ncbi:MAG: B12-binding domain-containing radical SAM protein [Candidatus Omnitrophica bacterium]|nr:B12-binding domain-containing radical SAM protein [Candidatus Omnitrophota bacterium]
MDADADRTLEYAKMFNPDIIGISVTTLTAGYARKLAAKSKNTLKNTLVVLGGPHITALPYENLDVADICVIGEGEQTFAELVDNFPDELSFEKIPGVAFKKNGKTVKTNEKKLIPNLDKLPFPAMDMYSQYRYIHIYPYRLKNTHYRTIITSRGCSYNCSFCMSELIWKREVRFRSLDNVFQEIGELVGKYKTSLLFIHDDNFTVNAARVYEFCRTKRKYFPELKWICHARADCLSSELLAEMKSAGCVEIQIGVESGDDTILSKCNKAVTTSTIITAFKMLRKSGINQWATFIIGNEGDDKESILKTINLSKIINPTYATFLFLLPLPGTKCFNRLSEKGFITTYDWSKYTWHGEPVFETESLSRKMLLWIRKKAFLEFYLRPSALIRCLFDIVKSRQWNMLFRGFMTIFKFGFGFIQNKRA